MYKINNLGSCMSESEYKVSVQRDTENDKLIALILCEYVNQEMNITQTLFYRTVFPNSLLGGICVKPSTL